MIFVPTLVVSLIIKLLFKENMTAFQYFVIGGITTILHVINEIRQHTSEDKIGDAINKLPSYINKKK